MFCLVTVGAIAELVPELTRDLLVLLVEALAVVGEDAASYFVAVPVAHLPPPVGIREGLPRGSYHVAVAVDERGLRGVERPHAAAADHGHDGVDCADGLADLAGQREIAAEGPRGVDAHGGHAFVPADACVGVSGGAYLGRLRVLEFAAFADRHEVHAGGGELCGEPGGFVHSGASIDDFVTEHPAADGRMDTHALANGLEDFEGEAHAPLLRGSVPVVAGVEGGEKARHRVGVGEVELDPVEAGLDGTLRRVGEEAGQGLRQILDVGEVRVVDAFALAVLQGVALPPGEGAQQVLLGQISQCRAHVALGGVIPESHGRSMSVGERKETPQESFLGGPATDPQEIDQLDEQARFPLAAFRHVLHEPREPRDETVSADAEQRPGWDVSNPRSFDHENPRATIGEAAVPVDHLRGGIALLCGAPRDHRRHPGPAPRREGADANRAEELADIGLGGGGPGSDGQRIWPRLRPCCAPRGGLHPGRNLIRWTVVCAISLATHGLDDSGMSATLDEMDLGDATLMAMETALVTGATGGIGGAIARRLAAMGMHVFASGRRLKDAQAFAEGVNANELIEGRCTGVELDVTTGDSVLALIKQLDALGITGVDWLINNAGSAETSPGTREGNHALMRRLMELNLYGPVRLFDVFGRGMLDRQRGGMIQVASSAGLQGYAYVSAYAATKHALLGWTRSLALECAPKGVIVSAVCPHYVDTPMTDRSIESMQTRSGRSEEDLRSFVASENPGGVLVTPEEVADSIVDLMHSTSGGVLIELPGGSRNVIEAGVPLQPATHPPTGSTPNGGPTPGDET